jgi:hypothetical protein
VRKTRALALFTALLGSAILLTSNPAEAITGPVDIRVEHDLLPSDLGPRVLEVSDVTPGDGPEITVADETENPDNWGGNVLVDIDPTNDTITVEVEEQNCYDTVVVEITTDEVGSITTLSDELFAPGDTSVTLTTSVVGGVVTLEWVADEFDCPGLGDAGSQAVFQVGGVGPSASISPESVQAGDPVTVSGTGCTNSPVEVLVVPDGQDEPVIEDEVIGDAEGDWSYEIDTTDLDVGGYDVATRCILADGQGFDYEVLGFSVSFEPAPAEPAPVAPTFTG